MSGPRSRPPCPWLVCLTGFVSGCALLFGPLLPLAQADPPRKKVVLIAGPKSHGPVGNGIHDYGWSACLLRVMLEHSSIKDRVLVEHYLDGWPKDPKALDDADTIMVISDGRDGDQYQEAPHLAGDERVRLVDRLMKRGCGLITFHFSTFTPQKYAEEVLDWTGGYFQWQTNGKRQWYSAITTTEAEVRPGTPGHPTLRGVKPFRLREEFYYNLRFRPGDRGLMPVWVVPALKGREPDGDFVAWAREREGGGRGFGTSCGHFYDNWKQDDFRKTVLNAIAWTAHVEAPSEGVQARFYTHQEIRQALGDGHVPAAPPTPAKPAGAGAAATTPSGQGPIPPDGPNYQPADPRLRAVLLDRSPDDAYLAVKVDTTGRVFVGGREAVFVFEPNSRGGYDKHRLLPCPPDSIVIGLELRGEDLYVLTNNALYLVPGGRTRREGLRAKRLVWGVPLDLHVSFHCVAWGPEGDLYLDHGDPLLNFGDWGRPDHWGHWTLHTQPEGTEAPYTGVGAVLRVKPDGSGLKVISTGYRGPVGLAFDRQWDLFTNDNDHESRADLYAPARLMHVTPHSDFAWPRGWMASKSPARSDLLEPMTPALGRGVPCGLAYYDEPLLGPSCGHSLLMGRWDRFALTRYPLQPRGASFQTEEQPFLLGRNQARPVGVAVGRGGRVFATALYLHSNPWSPHCVSDLLMIAPADDPDTHPFEPYDLLSRPAGELWADLSSPSWERRSSAHQEVLRRGGPLLDEAVRRLATVKPDDPAILHLPWLAGAGGSAEAARLLTALLDHPRPQVRLQAVRVLTEFPALKAPPDRLAAALADPSDRVRLAALAFFFQSPGELRLHPVVELARSEDTYLRQTAVKLLAERANIADITALMKSPDQATRRAGVLAAGIRLTAPPSHSVPPEAVRLTYSDGNARFTLNFADAPGPVDLHSLGRTGSYTTAQWWKAIRPTPEQQQLFSLLVSALDDPADPVRLQAAYWLSLLRDPRSDMLVERVFQHARERDLAAAPLREVGKVWAVGPFQEREPGFAGKHPPEEGAIDLTASYGTPQGRRQWQEVEGKAGALDTSPFELGRQSSVYFYFRLQSVSRRPALLVLRSDAALRVWHNGSPVRLEGEPRTAPLDLQPGSNDLLIRLQTPGGAGRLELHYRAGGDVTVSLPEKLDSGLLAERLREAGSGGSTERVSPEFFALDWPREVPRGDAGQGRRLFGSLGCVKCHAITADQKGGGAPSLADARKRFTVPYLVESILLPGKQVADPFRSTVLTTTAGRVITGLVVAETDDQLEVLLPDATRQTVRKKEVEERAQSPLSPMPAGLVKKPQELRDLLAYLLSDNPLPP